ncbi:uncharacterized protein LOC144990015 [Oryzias latipes]
MTERSGQTPDPADPEGLRFTISQQGIALGRQAAALDQIASSQQELFRRLDGLSQMLKEATGQLASPATTATLPAPNNVVTSASAESPENIRLQPEPFFGDVETCGGFLLQCHLIFQQAPRYYLSDHSKITLIINSLRNKALQWAQAFLAVHPISHFSYEHFLGEFQLVFDQPKKQEEAACKLLALKQRNVLSLIMLSISESWLWRLDGQIPLSREFSTNPSMKTLKIISAHNLRPTPSRSSSRPPFSRIPVYVSDNVKDHPLLAKVPPDHHSMIHHTFFRAHLPTLITVRGRNPCRSDIPG